MARTRASTLVATLLGLSALGATCDAFVPLESGAVLGRLGEVRSLVGAYELQPTCDLAASPADALPSREQDWRPLAKNELYGRTLVVEEKRPFAFRKDKKDAVYAALRVLDGKANKRFWLRNAPAGSVEDAQKKWACLVAEEDALAAAPKLVAPRVALSPRAWECTDLSPVFGGRHDVSLEPYDVTQRTLVTSPGGKPYLAMRLVQKEPERTLTLPSTVLDRCFVAAEPDAPRLDDDARALAGWLEGPSPETTAPPPLAQAQVERIAGIDARTCPRWGPDAAPTHACRVPVARLTTLPEPGPFGPPRVRLVRERQVDALYLRGGVLVATSDAPATSLVVRTKAGAPAGFVRALDAELKKIDPERTRRRLLAGARLLRPADVTRAAPATHTIELEIAYPPPALEPSTEVWTHKYVAGKKDVGNPARARAEAALFDARAAAESFDREVVLAERVAGDPAWTASAIAARTAAQRRVAEAEAAVAAAAASLAVDDDRTWDFSTKVLRRRGDAVYHVTITAEGKTRALELDTSGSVAFDVMDPELPADAEHKVAPRAARAPTPEDVDRKVASLVVERLEQLLVKWDAQKSSRGDVGDMLPWSRSWMVGVARQATNGRPVRLLGDLIERRSDVLAFETVTYGVTLNEDARRGCLVFAATAGGTSAVDLELGRKVGPSVLPVARDVRPAADAAVEVCALAPGEYVLTASWSRLGETRRPLVVSMYDASPGRVAAEDTAGAARGLPYLAKAGETLRFGISGLQRVGAGGEVTPISAVGDRDGDGIPDETDQCPELPETRNGHLDHDGCPDDVPKVDMPINGGEL